LEIFTTKTTLLSNTGNHNVLVNIHGISPVPQSFKIQPHDLIPGKWTTMKQWAAAVRNTVGDFDNPKTATLAAQVPREMRKIG